MDFFSLEDFYLNDSEFIEMLPNREDDDFRSSDGRITTIYNDQFPSPVSLPQFSIQQRLFDPVSALRQPLQFIEDAFGFAAQESVSADVITLDSEVRYLPVDLGAIAETSDYAQSLNAQLNDFNLQAFDGSLPSVTATNSATSMFDFAVTTVNDTGDPTVDGLIQTVTDVTVAALEIWGSFITGAAGSVLDVAVTIASQGPGVVASAGSQFFFDLSGGGPIFEVVSVPQIELQGGGDPNGTTPDIFVTVNSDFLTGSQAFVSTDPLRDPPPGSIDYVSVLAHEILHGLGFSSFRNNDGIFPAQDVTGDGVPDEFDSTYGLNVDFADLGDPFLTATFNGANLIDVYGEPVILETTTNSGGSDVSHFARGLPGGGFLADTRFALENPSVVSGDVTNVGQIELAVLRDIGFDVIVPAGLGLLNVVEDAAPAPVVSVNSTPTTVNGNPALTVELSGTTQFSSVLTSVGIEIAATNGTVQTQRVKLDPATGASSTTVELSQDILNAIAGAGGTDDLDVRLFFPAQAVLSNGGTEITSTITVTSSTSNTPTPGDDFLTGTSGNDTIDALAGNDTIEPGTGVDVVIGGDGFDQVNFAWDRTSFGFGGFDPQQPNVFTDNNGNQVSLTGVELVTFPTQESIEFTNGTTGDDNIAAVTGFDALISGGSGDDTLTGVGGDDFIDGSNGADVIDGGSGDDFIAGDVGTAFADTITSGDGADTIFGQTIDFDGDTITDFSADDTLQFSQVLFSLNDLTITTTAASTIIEVDDNQDMIIDATFTLLGDFTAAVFLVAADGFGGTAITLGLPGMSLTGTAGDDSLTGGNGNDTLDGLAGIDTLVGLEGDDVLNGGDGDFDLILPGSGNNIIDGGAGIFDRVQYDFGDFGFGVLDVQITDSFVTDTLSGRSDSLSGIETVTFFAATGTNDDRIDASLSSANVNLGGGAGNDTLIAGSGGSFLQGGTGSNALIGGAGFDTANVDFFDLSGPLNIVVTDADVTETGSGTTSSFSQIERFFYIGQPTFIENDFIDGSSATIQVQLQGGGGDDTILGGVGDDWIEGDEGVDTLTGGAGADLFDYDLFAEFNTGADVITDFEVGDVIDLSSIPFIEGITLSFIGEGAFTGLAGEYRFERGGGVTLVEVDSDGDGFGDATIRIENGEFRLSETSAGSNVLELVDVVISGTNAPESLSGTVGNDTINGFGGEDTISGLGGDDLLRGGSENDSLAGGDGNDILGGDLDNDSINGGAGNDELIGSFGDDTLAGEDDDDTIIGGGQNDDLSGGAGNDFLSGENGFDTIFGDAGNDQLNGGANADVLDGGDGSDTLLGQDGFDNLSGGLGIDTLRGGRGTDILNGGADNDALGGDLDNDTVDGGDGDDTVVGSFGNDSLTGGPGNDLITGGGQNDTLDGGDGDDFVSGENGFDTVRGGAGNDQVNGGDNADNLFGGADNDTLNGGNGLDRLFGETGNDQLSGNADNDILNGDAGFDTLDGGIGDDELTGGSNWDVFVFGNGFGNDVITDFDQANAFEAIDLSAVSAITDFADLSTNHLSEINGDAVITAGANTITLSGVSMASLTADDFIF